MGIGDSLKGAAKTAGNTALDAAKAAAGIVEKAVIILADTSEVEITETNAPNPSAGKAKPAASGLKGSIAAKQLRNFNAGAIAGVVQSEEQRLSEVYYSAIDEKKIKKYRFEVQFNPAEISISGYGGERLPTQQFVSDKNENAGNKNDNDETKINPKPSSRMAAADTRINMTFRVVFDKVDPQDAFYSDKFTLGQTSIIKGAVKAGLKAAGKKNNSVQNEVEALHAAARNKDRRLAMFIWGDMVYEGKINSVDSEYVMFNVSGQPVRAYVTINMVLFGKEDLGKNIENWKREYNEDFYKLQDPVKGLNVGMGS